MEFVYDLAFLRSSILIIHSLLEGLMGTQHSLGTDTKGTVVSDEKKSPLASNSNKVITVPNHIPNSK